MTDTVNEKPVLVHLGSVETGVQLGQPAAPAKRRLRGHYQTFQLTVNDPVQCILPQDDNRVKAIIAPLDKDVVIGTQGQCQSPLNTVAAVPQPQGFYAAGTGSNVVWIEVLDNNAVWAGITTTVNSRISVAAFYRD